MVTLWSVQQTDFALLPSAGGFDWTHRASQIGSSEVSEMAAV